MDSLSKLPDFSAQDVECVFNIFKNWDEVLKERLEALSSSGIKPNHKEQEIFDKVLSNLFYVRNFAARLIKKDEAYFSSPKKLLAYAINTIFERDRERFILFLNKFHPSFYGEIEILDSDKNILNLKDQIIFADLEMSYFESLVKSLTK